MIKQNSSYLTKTVPKAAVSVHRPEQLVLQVSRPLPLLGLPHGLALQPLEELPGLQRWWLVVRRRRWRWRQPCSRRAEGGKMDG